MIPQFNNNNNNNNQYNNNNNNQYGNYNQGYNQQGNYNNQGYNQGQYNNQKKEYNNYYIYIPSFLIGQEFKYSCQVKGVLPDNLIFFASKSRIFKNEYNTMSPVLTISIDLDKNVSIENNKEVSIHDFVNNYQRLIVKMKDVFSAPEKIMEYLKEKYNYDTLNFIQKLDVQNELLAWKKTIFFILEKEAYNASKSQHNNNIQTNNAPQQINIVAPQTAPETAPIAPQQVTQQTQTITPEQNNQVASDNQNSPEVINLDSLVF